MAYYDEMFATSMHKKWDCRVYIDLFAGAGRARLERTNRIVEASPLRALKIAIPFDKYIFCEADSERLEALRKRSKQVAPQSDIEFISGDVNENVEKVLSAIPSAGTEYKVLGFCFADPYRTADLKFSTIRKLASRYCDFLILIPTFMDIQRNEETYLRPENTVIEEFLGLSTWRSRWQLRERERDKFGPFIADIFGQQMRALGFRYQGLVQYEPIKMGGNRPLYYLGFFSKSETGDNFWEKARKGSSKQRGLPFG